MKRSTTIFLQHTLSTAWVVAMTTFPLQGQDLYFSQFHEAPMLRNPALAGIFSGDYRYQAVYRNQWHSISIPYQTGSMNMERKSTLINSDDFLTLGLQLLYDRAGSVAMSSGHLLPVVNYHKSVSAIRSSYLSLGFFGGLVTRRLDRSKVTTDSQFDGISFNGSLPDNETFSPGYAYFDAGAGLSFNSSMGRYERHLYFIGASYHHFNRPVNAFYRNITHLPKWVLSAGLRLELSEIAHFTFHGDQILQPPFRQTILGGLYDRKLGDATNSAILHMGLFHRWGDALIPTVRISMQPVNIGFSYDVTVGNVAAIARARGGFEVSMSYAGFNERNNSAQYAVKCPKF